MNPVVDSQKHPRTIWHFTPVVIKPPQLMMFINCSESESDYKKAHVLYFLFSPSVFTAKKQAVKKPKSQRWKSRGKNNIYRSIATRPPSLSQFRHYTSLLAFRGAHPSFATQWQSGRPSQFRWRRPFSYKPPSLSLRGLLCPALGLLLSFSIFWKLPLVDLLA